MRVAVIEGAGEAAKARFQKVVIGRDFGAEAEIVSGLSGDEQVVTNPGERLADGVAVTVSARPTTGPQRQHGDTSTRPSFVGARLGVPFGETRFVGARLVVPFGETRFVGARLAVPARGQGKPRPYDARAAQRAGASLPLRSPGRAAGQAKPRPRHGARRVRPDRTASTTDELFGSKTRRFATVAALVASLSLLALLPAAPSTSARRYRSIATCSTRASRGSLNTIPARRSRSSARWPWPTRTTNSSACAAKSTSRP